MKHNKLFLTLLLGCFLSILMLTENKAQVITGNVELQYQSDVDAFDDGPVPITTITGNLTIRLFDDYSDINDLTPLSTLTSVGGNLNISFNPALTSLTGLDALSSVLSLIIEDNLALTEFCSLFPLLNINGLNGGYIVTGNAINPTQQQIIDAGACGTFNGNVTLSTQADVISFGANNYSTITGDLTISGSDINDLSPLSTLTSVEGFLYIRDNSALQSLAGLDALTSVGGSLLIRNNAALTSLTGLDALESVGGFLEISNNSSLTSLAGLDALNSVEGFLYIQDNTALTSLSGLDALTSVGGTLLIQNNSALTSLTGLDAITSVGGDLNIYNNAVLTSLSVLDALTSVGGYINISTNAALTSLTGLDAITSVGGDLSIYNNAVLTSLTGLDAITSVGGLLNISNNAVLTSLTGLDAITSVGNLSVNSNPALTNLTGLDALTTIGGNLSVQSNSALTSLTGLDAITSVGGDLRIYNNAVLTSLSVLDALTSVGGLLNISNNAVLTSLSGLDAITSVGGLLNISNNAVLTSLSGLDALTSVGGPLFITGNSALTNLDGLSSLSSVGEVSVIVFSATLTILNNLSLSSFCGLYPLFSSGIIIPSQYLGILSISGNAINPIEADILAGGPCSPPTAVISGSVFVNSTGLQGVKVALLDSDGLPVAGQDTLVTDAQGAYSFPDIQAGNYLVTVIEPLGYTSVENPIAITAIGGGSHTVDFVLEQAVVINRAKIALFWTGQFISHIWGFGHPSYSESELNGFIADIQTHYTPHFDIFQDRVSLSDWYSVLKVWGNFTKYERARRQLAAMLFNLVSGKIGQYTVVTNDGRTFGDVLTYVSVLLTDGNSSNDDLALDLASKVNRRKKINSGLIPASTILYKDGQGLPSIDYGFGVPDEFALTQNFPNPFNPTTEIQYAIPTASNVKLEIFNITGEKVATLVDGFMSEGTYKVSFNASSLPSGIYLYRINAGSFLQTRKMILLK